MSQRLQARGVRHVVRQGECLASIAEMYGFRDFDSILSHAANAELKECRTNPHVLKPGDVVFVPDLAEATYERPTNQRHRFRRIRGAVFLKLRLRDPDGNTVANRKYRLMVDDFTSTGFTDADGRLEERIPATAERGKLFLWENNEDSDPSILLALEIGHLDPVEEASGVQARLHNLGYQCPPSGSIDGATRNALRKFQREHELTETGEPDEATRRKLVELHEFQ